MMFSSSPLDKNCINSDSCSSSRNNAPNRFSAGIAPLGDENQQIRIQLAVHKYNGTTGSPFNNRCSFMSPNRHSFLKNSLKVRNYEGDCEGTSKTDKRNGNQYEGVGSFPTIHLKKNALRYRPIRRFHDVKIPYPELPVNRFLSHLPEVCPDLKSSTRSFLDVLEDLSGNKIHSKDDNGCSKSKPQGLGGDYLLNPNAVFKPLFVQKPKSNAVLTRDNTTQTLSPISKEIPSPQGASSSHVRNGPPDPRAELRRKLAKQNNEIFASLSSSISSAFCLKRKLDKVLPSKDDGHLGESALKKTKMSDHRPRESNENGLAKSVIAPAENSSESVKLSKKTKFSDTNSVSPNKDRLTTIFLDTRNTSPKARVFQANTSSESKFTEKGSQVTSTCHSETNGESADKTESPLANSFAGGNGSNERTHTSLNFSSSETSNKQEMGQSDKPVISSLTSKSNASTKDTASASPLQLGATAADTSNFSSPKTVIGNVSYSSESSKSIENGNDLDKKESNGNGKEMSGGFSFGKANDKTIFGPFKFGVDGSTPLPQNKVLTDPKGSTAEPVPAASIEPSNSTTQFSLTTTSSVTASPLQTSALCFGTTSSQNTFTFPGKPTFTLGYTAPSGLQSSTNSEGKLGTSVATPTSSAATTVVQSTHPVTFTFGQKPIVSSAPTNHVSPAGTPSLAASLNQNSWSSTGTSGPVFASEQKPEFSVTSSAGPTPVIQGQIKTSPFVFGQKETEVESGQKTANVFSTEQKSVLQPSTQASAVPTDSTASNQPSNARMNQAFSQVVSTAPAAPQVTITQNFVSEASTTFGTKFEGSSSKGLPASEFNPANPVFPNKTASFGSSINAFGKTTSGFTTSTSGAPAFGFQVPATTQSIPPFGGSPAIQSAPTFGSSSTTQSAPTFGSSSTTQSAPTFGSSSTTQSAPTFGSSSAAQSAPTFGSSSAAQSAPTFGSSSTTQSAPTFGSSSVAQSAPTFGSSSAAQSAPIFGSSSTTQSAPTFGSSPATQPAPTFGSSASQAGPAFGPPASQSTSGFVVPTTTQTPPTFGSSAPHSTPTFGSPNKQLAPSFGTISTTQSTTPTFPGVSSQSPFPFGTSAMTQTTGTPLMRFKMASSNNNASMLFGTSTSNQSPVSFGPTTTQNNITFGPSPGFTTPFSTQSTTSAPAFAASHSLDNKPAPCPSEANMFPQNSSPAFSTSNVFTSNQNNIFARKPATETSILDQNKPHTSAFGSTSQVFGSQNKFSFGTSTSNATPFTTSAPTTTAPMVYSFGGGTTGNTFTFGGNSSSAPSNTFAFGSPATEPFKFGATTTAAATTTTSTTTTKEGGTPFGGGPSTTFSFAGQMSNPPVAEQKPSFNFGSTQTSNAAAGFHFGATPSPSVFNFGGSSSSGSSGSSFNFGTPTSGVGFGQTASPGASFAVPGTFNIGSGSTQSRPRASSRPRRRP